MPQYESRLDDLSTAELYVRLKPIARNLMQGQPADHTLRTTALVHECMLKFESSLPQLDRSAADRTSIARQAGTTMRRILIDHARRKASIRLGGRHDRVALDSVALVLSDGDGRTTRTPIDLEKLQEALLAVQAADADAAQVIEWKFFGGMTTPQVALARGESEDKIRALWERAKRLLLKAGGGGALEGAADAG